MVDHSINAANGASLLGAGEVGKLGSEMQTPPESAKLTQREQKPVRTGSGSKSQSAVGGSPQAAAKHVKGQRTMQSFFTSKPSS